MIEEGQWLAAAPRARASRMVSRQQRMTSATAANHEAASTIHKTFKRMWGATLKSLSWNYWTLVARFPSSPSVCVGCCDNTETHLVA